MPEIDKKFTEESKKIHAYSIKPLIGLFVLFMVPMTKLLHDVIKQREYFGKHEKDICSAYTINADSVSLHDTRGLGFSSIFDKDLPKDTTITSYYVGQNKDTIIGLMTKQQPWAELIDDNKKLVRHSNGRYGGYYADTVNITLK